MAVTGITGTARAGFTFRAGITCLALVTGRPSPTGITGAAIADYAAAGAVTITGIIGPAGAGSTIGAGITVRTGLAFVTGKTGGALGAISACPMALAAAGAKPLFALITNTMLRAGTGGTLSAIMAWRTLIAANTSPAG